MLDTPCSEVVWRVLATHSIRQFPLHFPSLASPCAVTFQLESTYAPVIRLDCGKKSQIHLYAWHPFCFLIFESVLGASKTAKSDYYLRDELPPARMERLGSNNGFSWNLTFEYIFENLWSGFKCHYNMTTITVALREDRYTFLTICHSVLLGMRNFSFRNGRENRNTHFVFNSLLMKSCRSLDDVEKHCRVGAGSWQYGACALHVRYLSLQTHT